MGIYLNPGSERFEESLNSEIYIDKSELIHYVNRQIGTEQKYLCVSRPRRFGKSMAANMLAAYYGRGYDSQKLFMNLNIAMKNSFKKHINRYNVIFLNMQEFWGKTHNVKLMKERIEEEVLWDLLEENNDVHYYNKEDLIRTIQDIYINNKVPFIFIIDEWDCIFRENQDNTEAQKYYLDFLRNLLKDKTYVKLAYMTGILPIKKYGSHSALNMFSEFSMIEPEQLAEFVGFTEAEVEELCQKYSMDFAETQRWYDGYQFSQSIHIYSPRSVVSAMLNHRFGDYWTRTETYEALKIYIEMNYDDLKDTIIELLAGGRKKIDTGTFTNDMTTFRNADDVLTLLVHLGYLGYNVDTQEVFIPNSEVSGEFVNAIKGAGWKEVFDAVTASDELLKATWSKDETSVSDALEKAHSETSILTYHDENALAYTLSLAYYSARQYYTIFGELPTGKGFADLVFLPRKNHQDKPAMIVELKWNKSVESAVNQILEKDYGEALKDYKGRLLLVAVNYNKKNKKHECKIEMV